MGDLQVEKNIIFEDEHILVVYKPAGIATQTSRIGQRDMVSELKNYLAGRNGTEPYLGLVHRLDQPVSGVLVFAKEKQAASLLCGQVAGGAMKKHYYALIYGACEEPKEQLVDYLYKDGRENRSLIVDETFPDAKKAVLNYVHKTTLMVLEKKEEVSLVEIELLTGRHHQIRAQMAYHGMSLLGDSKYGSTESRELSRIIGCRNVALCAYKLSFQHPATREYMTFERLPEEEMFQPFFHRLENRIAGLTHTTN